jgi:hypothetical protein
MTNIESPAELESFMTNRFLDFANRDNEPNPLELDMILESTFTQLDREHFALILNFDDDTDDPILMIAIAPYSFPINPATDEFTLSFHHPENDTFINLPTESTNS